MEELLLQLARVAKTIAEAVAVLVVGYGVIEGFLRLLWIAVTPGATHGERKEVWRRLGMWLLLALEFELAADIVGSVVSPSWQDIGELGAIAVIRTFLNYFLERDLEESEQEKAVATVPAPEPEKVARG
jgi:uncharacterized membrane protein